MNPTIFYQLIQDWKGTPMEDVINILKTGDFTDSLQKVVKDKIIGEMTPLEKAIFSQITVLQNKMNEQLLAMIANSCAGDTASIACFDCSVYKAKTCPIYEQIHNAYLEWDKNAKPLQKILAKIVHERLGVDSCYVAKGFLLISQDQEFKSTYKKSRTKTTKQGFEVLFESSIQGTFLQTVMEIMESEEFASIEIPIAEGEKVIATLNSFGNAMATMITKQYKEAEKIFEELKKSSNNVFLLGLGLIGLIMAESYNDDDFKKNEDLIEKLRRILDEIQALEPLLYGLLEEPTKEEIDICLFLRTRFAVVTCCEFCSLSEECCNKLQ